MTTPHLMPSDESTARLPHHRWVRARDSALAIIGWLVIVWIVFTSLGHVAGALIILALGSLLAYVLSPLVGLLGRVLPRWLAILLVYLGLLALIASVGYFIVSSAAVQLQAFAAGVPTLIQPNGPLATLIDSTLRQLGFSDTQIQAAGNQAAQYLQSLVEQVANQAVPILTGIASALLDTVLTLVVSIYLVVDGPRVMRWLKTKTPLSQRARVRFAVELIDRTVGGYIRGELLLASLVGLLVGGGMYLFQLPYAVLLGVLAFVLEFIPILGVFISGAACVLVAFTHGFGVALAVLAFFVLVHVIEGDILGPRIIGHVLGLHPVVAILALIVGADLFGFWGAVIAAPTAGVIQALLVALWQEWIESHPQEFPSEPAAAGASSLDGKAAPRRLFGIGATRARKPPQGVDPQQP